MFLDCAHPYLPNYMIFMCSTGCAILRNHLNAALVAMSTLTTKALYLAHKQTQMIMQMK